MTSNLTPDSTASSTLAMLHLIPYLRWEREGQATFESQRGRLLDVLMWCIQHLQKQPSLDHILLGGQTVILEDAAAVRQDLVNVLIMNNNENRLEIGPWYVQVDDAFVSGESL